ncbi:MAG: glycerophosphodiester phosphodiesterase [Ignavibacteria bacterium]|nr:glycerophosphodiester phosphodiesterase [Ignavibacteria bacterium]
MSLRDRMASEVGSPIIVAHRGISAKAPENTISAFTLALETPGIHVVELDVRLSKDEEVIVLHDRTLQRTTTGNGAARAYTLRELRSFDAGSWFDPKFSHERIPTLREVLDLVGRRLAVNVELKSDPLHREPDGLLERRVLDVVREIGVAHRVVYSSFRHHMMANIRRMEPNAVTGVIYSMMSNFASLPSSLAKTVGASFFVCAKHELRQAMIRDAHQHDVAVFVYTLNSVSGLKRFLDLGADGIISDAADDVVAALEQSKQWNG